MATAKTTRSKKAAAAPLDIRIPKLHVRTFELPLVGDTPLLVHRFDEKTRREMEDKNTKKARGARAARDPEQEYRDSLYVMPGSEKWYEGKLKPEKTVFGFPASAFKAAAITAVGHVQGLTKINTRGVFHVMEEDEGLVTIYDPDTGKPAVPTRRDDVVRIGMGTATNRYRGQFKRWMVKLQIRFNPDAMPAEQIVNLFNTAGFSVGVGEWRPTAPKSSGSYGTFSVVGVSLDDDDEN